MASQVNERETNSLGNSEKLGREERSKTSAKRSFHQLRTKGKVNVRASKFEPSTNTNEISVNRMDIAPTTILAQIGARNANSVGKKFWGWYTLTAEDIKEVGCNVKPTPLKENPYHADIVIPVILETDDRKNAIREYARDLAYRAEFLPWGEWTNEI